MQLGLKTIASLGDNGGNKADVLKSLFAIKDTSSVLGSFGFQQGRRHDPQVLRRLQGGQPTASRCSNETVTPTKTVS